MKFKHFGRVLSISLSFSVVGYSIAVTLYYYDYYSYIFDRAKLASLQYSFSGRLALRTEQAING